MKPFLEPYGKNQKTSASPFQRNAGQAERISAAQEAVVQQIKLAAGKPQDALIPHSAQLPRKGTAIHAEEVCQLSAVVGQRVAVPGGRGQGLQIDFKTVPQPLLGQNADLGVEKQKLLRHVLHEVGRYLHPTGTAQRLLGQQVRKIQLHHGAVGARPQADRAGRPAGAGQFGPKHFPAAKPADADLVAVLIVQKFLNTAFQQHAGGVGLFAQLHKMLPAPVGPDTGLEAGKHLLIFARLDVVEHAALLQNGIILFHHNRITV